MNCIRQIFVSFQNTKYDVERSISRKFIKYWLGKNLRKEISRKLKLKKIIYLNKIMKNKFIIYRKFPSRGQECLIHNI